ncbi:MAG: haloacid dehalogenase-like hydrolase [Muribaculaceae bacterium]|nr:haloacid dehalogenase-like hydrolase [Muribaculaceae bacterium]
MVDLDGTLLRGNSFKLYVRAALEHLPLSERITIGVAYLLRKARVISHNEFRSHVVATAGFPEEILDYMRRHAVYSRAVLDFINVRQAQGYSIMLATAALAPYVHALWDGAYVASSVGSEGRVEYDCRGEAKLHAVTTVFNGSLPAFFLTDSEADAPLIVATAQAGGTPVLVNPSCETEQAFPDVRVIRD